MSLRVAWRQGPGRFSHVNVIEVGGLFRARRQSSASDSFTVLRSGSSTGHRDHRAGVRERVLGSMRERVLGVSPYGVWNLAVWPLVSGRVASGLSPRGVTSFVHARLGVRGNQGRMVCNLPSPCPSTCYRCPDGALWWLASAKTKRPTMGFSLIGALPAYEPRRQGGRECERAVTWIQHALGWPRRGTGSNSRADPP